METSKIISVLESILFMSGEPVSVSRLAKVIGVSKEAVSSAIENLSETYNDRQSGLHIIKKGDSVQLVTSPENSKEVEQLIKGELQDNLSPAALEVLSIIAYKGPISKSEIEAIRGVNCSYTVRNLLIRGLIERGDKSKDSRGYVYEITFDFMKKMGIDDIKKLPQYEELSKDERITSIIEQ